MLRRTRASEGTICPEGWGTASPKWQGTIREGNN